MAVTPGQRVNLTKGIGEALEDDNVADIDLVLDTFGVPAAPRPTELWSPQKYDYVLRRVAKANSQIVVELYAHLYPDSPQVATSQADHVTGGSWAESEFRLFLSHHHAHRVLAGQLRERLKLYGIDTFVAHDMIEPTMQWRDEIETALGTCDALAALLTPEFLESKWCDQEVGTALGRGRCIVGIKQGAEPHGFIGKYQAVNGDTSPWAAQNITDRIVDALWANPQTRPLMARAAAVAYAESISFDNARANFARVRELRGDEWTDEMVRMVESAGRENRQLEEGISLERDTLNEPIPDLLKKHLDQLLDRTPPTGLSDFEGAATGGGEDDIPF
jgi:hypothetical protein